MTPPRPVVAYIISPVVDDRPDPLAMQDLFQIAQGPQALIFPGSTPAAHENKSAVVLFDPRMILRHIGQKAFHGIVIECAVHPAMVVVRRIINTGQGDHPAEQFWSSEKSN